MAASTTLRLPDALKADADAYAARVGVSLNALCLIALRDYLDARQGPAAERVRREMEKIQLGAAEVARLSVPRVGANQPCPCGSGEKYKRCHGKP
jgi:hypothetical protein